MTALAPPDLAQAIEREHAAANGHARSALEHALECGRLLAEFKAGIPHGDWLPWVEANLSFGERQARRYMRLATHRDELSNRTSESDFTIEGALASLGAQSNGPESAIDDEVFSALGAATRRRSPGRKGREQRQAARPEPAAEVDPDRQTDLVMMAGAAIARSMEPDPPPVDLIPANDALLLSWLRDGDAREVAHRLLQELGAERLRGIWAHLPRACAVPPGQLPARAPKPVQTELEEPIAAKGESAVAGITAETPAEPADDDLRRRLSDRLADRLDDAGCASEAQKIGISAPILKSFLVGNPIYDNTRTKIETYLSN
jgi:hypothetical protein